MKILMRRLIRSCLTWITTVCKCMSEFTPCPELPDFSLFISGPLVTSMVYQKLNTNTSNYPHSILMKQIQDHPLAATNLSRTRPQKQSTNTCNFPHSILINQILDHPLAATNLSRTRPLQMLSTEQVLQDHS